MEDKVFPAGYLSDVCAATQMTSRHGILGVGLGSGGKDGEPQREVKKSKETQTENRRSVNAVMAAPAELQAELTEH